MEWMKLVLEEMLFFNKFENVSMVRVYINFFINLLQIFRDMLISRFYYIFWIQIICSKYVVSGKLLYEILFWI